MGAGVAAFRTCAMAPRLNSRPPPTGFPSWPEFAAVTLLVLWLVAIVAVEPGVMWIHLMVPAAALVLVFSFWNTRSPREDS